MSVYARCFNKVLILCLITAAVATFNCWMELLNFCRCLENVSAGQYVVDCSNSGLYSVPQNIPKEATHLYFDNNNLNYLQRNSFPVQYLRLEVLSIRNNKLKKLSSGSFENLCNLKQLFLYNNSLQYKDSLPKSLFIPLRTTMKILDIRMNIPSHGLRFLGYPKSVAELHNLEELRMDIVRNRTLSQEYSNMSMLQKLIFAGGSSNVTYLDDNAFNAMSTLNISEINLSGLDIGFIGPLTFSSLSFLRQLDLSNNLDIYINLGNIAESLRKTSVRILRLNNTGIGNPSNPTSILKKFCNLSLEELIFDNNFIHHLGSIFRDCFSNMRVLSLADNYLLTNLHLIRNIMFLENLVGLNFSYQNTISHSRPNENRYDRLVLSRRKREEHMCMKDMACPLAPPPNLLWIDLSHSGLFTVNVPKIVLLSNSTLKYFKASYCGIQTMGYPLYCPRTHTSPQIQTIDLNNNNLQCITASMFNQSITNCNWNSLKRLHLKNNKLGQIEGNVCNKDKNNIFGFLEPLHSLMVLDISSNNLLSDKKLTVLQTLSEIQELDLSSNKFQNFSLNLKNFTKLRKLDLPFNKMQCLSKSTMFQLNKLQKLKQRHLTIHVDLSGNLFTCECECLSFFHWMTTTNVYLLNNKTYECRFSNKRRVTLNKLSPIVAQLESDCYGLKWLNIYIASELSVYFLILVLCFTFRNRHTLKYMYWRLGLNRQTARLDGKQYLYNAFISYEHRDAKFFLIRKLLPKLETPDTKLKFCIAQRDFVVVVAIVDNIMRAMDRSKKIIFIISQYFLTSNWCKEELRIAHQYVYFIFASPSAISVSFFM